jgi:hypothetical protein
MNEKLEILKEIVKLHQGQGVDNKRLILDLETVYKFITDATKK